MWTALPRGADATKLTLDVFVSPRLGVDAPVDSYTLAEFPEFEHWTKTVDDHLTFEVELADGSRHPAEVVPAALDHDAWDHLFRATTFVRPWSFRDLSELPIYSFPARFVTAYMRDLYRDVGRKHPTTPPRARRPRRPPGAARADHRRARRPRSAGRRRATPPTCRAPRPAAAGAAARGLLRRTDEAAAPALQLAAPPARHAAARRGPPGPPPDPTRPKVEIPRVVHPSPYEAKPPLGPVVTPPIAAVEAQIAATKTLPPAASFGDMADALAARDPSFDFACVQRFYDRPEIAPPGPPPEPELDFHQAIGALGDYPEIMRRLGLIVRLRIPRPATDPVSVRVVPSWDGQTRATDVAPRTRCELDGDGFTAAERGGAELDGGMLDLAGADDRLAVDTPKFDSDPGGLRRGRAQGRARRGDARAPVPAPDRAAARHRHPGRAGDAGAALRRAGDRAARPRPLRPPAPPRGSGARRRAARAGPGRPGAPPERALRGGPRARLPGRRLRRRRGLAFALLAGRQLPPRRRRDATPRARADHRRGLRQVDLRDLGRGGRQAALRARGARALDGLEPDRAAAGAHARASGAPQPPPPGDYERPALPSSDARTEFRLETTFEPKPGTLPRLRFGTSYRVRVACVDLAGELLAPAAAAEPRPRTRSSTAASSPCRRRRRSPCAPSGPASRSSGSWLRSDYDRDNATYDQQAMGAGTQDSRAHRGRHLFPPKAAQQMAELHGKLDLAFGARRRPRRRLPDLAARVGDVPRREGDRRRHGGRRQPAADDPLRTAQAGRARRPGCAGRL